MGSWFAVPAGGAARRVSGLGLVIGRAATCDVLLAASEVSRRHVLLQLGAGSQLDIVPLPGARTIVNGVAIEAPVVARDGDVLTFPGGATVRLAFSGDEHAGEPHAWILEVRGRRIGLRRETLVLGGGDDDVMLETWPAAAAQLTWPDDGPAVEALVPGLRRNDQHLAPGVTSTLAAGDRLACDSGVVVTIATEPATAPPTEREVATLEAITLEMMPTGGMVTVTTTRGEHHALLAERRFALLMTLLRPPSPYAVGQYVADDVLFAAVWPRNDAAGRTDLNQLVKRLRADLRAAGLDGNALIERAAKGGATRIALPPDVVITLRS